MVIPALTFLVAATAGLVGGRGALRAVAVAAILLVPLRGGLLALAADLPFEVSDLAVNAIVPALVAALVLGVAVRLRPDPGSFPRPLVAGWLVIAGVALLNTVTAAVALKLYGVGLAQYLVYPTLALAIVPLLEPGDERRLAWLFVGLGTFVAITALIQVTGIESFIQSASAEVEGLAANRYAGVTGSYLHTSSFLGVAAVLAMGLFIRSGMTMRDKLLGIVVLGMILSGIVLTFSRSGVVIAAGGVLALALFAARARRVRFVILIVPAVAAALAVGALAGVSPDEATDRVVSLAGGEADPGNKLRVDSIEEGVDAYRAGSAGEKVFGQGLAATGNASQLVEEQALIVESYYLKLLVETGVLGLLLIGAYLLCVAFCFAFLAWRGHEPWLVALGAAGVGLSLYNLIYPALETQILSLTWWLLAMICIRQLFVHAGGPAYLGRPRFLATPQEDPA